MNGSCFRWLPALLLVLMMQGCSTEDAPPSGERNWDGWAFLGDDGQWRTAEVPGSIHTDLMTHGLIPDPFQGVNEGAVQWVEGREWRYRCPVPPRPDDRTGWMLEFGGLDTYATVIVGEDTLLRADNMHRSWRVDWPDSAAGKYLEVVFDSPVVEGQRILDQGPWPIPVSNEIRPIGEQTSAVTRKAMYHYGWDWGPRLTTCGIWKPVRWVHPGDALPTFRLKPERVDAEEAHYTLRFDGPVQGVTARLALAGEGVPMTWEATGDGAYALRWSNPALWWPHGMGAQPLYELELTDAAGRMAHWRFGVRTVRWDRSADAFGEAMQCVVNGVPVQIRGANVIPPDFFPVRALEAWPRVIDDAVAAHMNMIRIWGGAHYGEEALLDLCDERGILVWQDFMNACAMVPEDASWKANFLAEAREQVVRLRNRTALAIWAGNNETEKAWREWGWQDLYDLHGADSVAVEEAYLQVFERLLPDLVSRLGGGEYWPSSPHHSDASRPRESGDQHDWGVWFGKAGFDFYSYDGGRFASEFGLQSLPDRRTLEEVGVRSYEDTVLQFRQRSKMEWLEPGFDGWDMMQFYADGYFRDPAAVKAEGMDRLDTWIYLTQLTQAEGLRQGVERHRCSQGRTSGSLYWQLDDVWPTVSWSTVDHAGRWKLAHHAVRHANQSLRVLPDREAGDRVALQVHNDGLESASGTLHWALVSLEGDTLHAQAYPVEVNAIQHLDLAFGVAFDPLMHLLTWEWVNGEGETLDRGVHPFRKAAEMDWPEALVAVEPMDHGVVLTADGAATGVWLRSAHEGRFEDNGFTLLAGERRRIGFVGPSGEPADPGVVTVVHFAQLQAGAQASAL